MAESEKNSKLKQHALGGVIDALAFLHKAPHKRPLTLFRLKVTLGEQNAQLALVEPENYTVDTYKELRIAFIEISHDRSA